MTFFLAKVTAQPGKETSDKRRQMSFMVPPKPQGQ